jgi:hypothetical protein
MRWLTLFLVACSSSPVDPREEPEAPVTALTDRAPPALSGGTLLESQSGLVYASNPDTGYVDVVDPVAGKIVWQARFDHDAQPGRLAEDGQGRVHVVLRGGGAIATLDQANRTTVTTKVCPEPRGIAAGDAIWVACAGGELVSVPLDLATPTIAARLGRDLRDVILANGNVYVTRFRTAELLAVDAKGTLISTAHPFDILDFGGSGYLADAAWRTLPAPDGSIYMLHQYAASRPIDLDPSQGEPAYGASSSTIAGDDCRKGRLVVAALTRFVDGHPSGTELFQFATGIDMSIGKDGGVILVHLPSNGSRAMVQAVGPSFSFLAQEPLPCQLVDDSVSIGGMAVATAGRYVQTRAGSTLVWNGGAMSLSPTLANPGFDLFHTPTKVGLACASCHPEGGDDGHSWAFANIGKRRTQSLRGGVLETVPLHWAGDESTIGDLVTDVFTHRMGGGRVSPTQVTALGKWLDQLPTPAAPSGLDAQAIGRGRQAFDTAQCSTCHSGPHMTNNQSLDVGTGGMFQVPTLLGVGARAPFIHDGCAPTMHDRLTDPFCAGVKHGRLDLLANADIADLEVFLDSL